MKDIIETHIYRERERERERECVQELTKINELMLVVLQHFRDVSVLS